MQPMRVGLLGMGTVGRGTWDVLNRNAEEIARRAGRPDPHQLDRDAYARTRAQGAGRHDGVQLTTDLATVVAHPDVDIVVELIGGIEPAKSLVLDAIGHRKHVVTANKALLAAHGNEIFAAAQKAGVMVAFEAAVAGGIPIIKALREGLTANRIEWIAGIINGTSNFILSEMRATGASFGDVLAEAQKRGYAEADPTFDIEGIDAAHKLTIMSAIAFGVPMQFDKAYTEGISRLTREDIRYAEELGYRIKLLGITRRASGAGRDGIELRVHPTLVPETRLIANVEGAMNAVLVKADAVGPTLYYGPGAGAEPTASAVIADLVDVTRMHTADPEHRVPHLAFQPDQLSVDSVPADGRSADQLLPAHARARPSRRARRHHAHPGGPRHLDRCHDPEGAARGAGPDRHHHAHAFDRREERHRGDRRDRGAAHRQRQRRAHPARGAELNPAHVNRCATFPHPTHSRASASPPKTRSDKATPLPRRGAGVRAAH